MFGFKEAWMIFVKGLAMGAADVVPGVSGGTVAFITGIYERLLNAIRQINFPAIQIWRKQGLKAAWDHIDGNFLLILFSGIMTSILSLAKIVSWLLEHHQLLVWSLFSGLILASAWHISKQIKTWSAASWISLALGCGFSLLVSQLSPASIDVQNYYYFFAGMIAICAMILPGISGSFILLILGMYHPLLTAVNQLQISALALFAGGALIGLLSFSHLLSYLLKRWHNPSYAVLTGFLLGSLSLLWPWKQVVSTYTSSEGIEKPLQQMNILPTQYAQLLQQDPQTLSCVALMLLGVVFIVVLERKSN
ncbi:DUF368 domain-containing protein [Alginatibacterium sediminis]|nr:DUF368 domain-containing protein [Alginatibacterium sediminis]